MNTSKTLTASVAAAALVGAIGMAYAQTSTTQPLEQQGTTAPMTPSQGSAQTTPSSNTLPSGSDNTLSAPMAERAPQADRN